LASLVAVERISPRSESRALFAAARAWRTMLSALATRPARFRRLGMNISFIWRRSMAAALFGNGKPQSMECVE
jgi:hypothetical protein